MSLLNNFNCQTNRSDLPVLLTVKIFYELNLLVLFMLENILLQRKYGWKFLPWEVPSKFDIIKIIGYKHEQTFII